MPRNCQCGTRPEANCVKCGSGICRTHKMDFDYRAPKNRGAIIGVDFEDAARKIGYWSKPRNAYYCDACRTLDCQPEIDRALRMRAGWGSTPFRQAIAAARQGYVYTDIGISTKKLLEDWIALQFQPKKMTLVRVVRPERYRSPSFLTGRSRVIPEKIINVPCQGWLLPRTYPGTTEDMHGCPRLQWEPIAILTDGTMVHNRNWTTLEELDDGNGYAYRLVVEMSRLVVTARGMTWKGPKEDW